MKVTIKIEVDDKQDVFTHLHIIKQTLKKEFKKTKKLWQEQQKIAVNQIPVDEPVPFTAGADYSIDFEDSNCYGYHSVEVEN